MKDQLEYIQDEWEKDSDIHRDDPDPLSVDQLHNKYWRYLSTATQELMPIIDELAILKIKKEQYFLNPTKDEAKATQWKYPASSKILKSEVKNYIAADPDILDLEKRINIIQLRVDFIRDIIKKIHSRSFLIQAHIDWERFKQGQ